MRGEFETERVSHSRLDELALRHAALPREIADRRDRVGMERRREHRSESFRSVTHAYTVAHFRRASIGGAGGRKIGPKKKVKKIHKPS